MYKKKISVVAILVIIVITAVRLVLYIKGDEYVYSYIACGCSAMNYEQKEDMGYLIISPDDSVSRREIIVKVSDDTLQKELSTSVISDIIGVNLEMKIPKSVLKEQNIDIDSFDALQYLATGQFDEYLILLDAAYTDLDNSGEKLIREAIDNHYKKYDPHNNGELKIFINKPLGVDGKRLVLAEKYRGDGHLGWELFLFDLSLNIESVAGVLHTMSPCFSICQIFYEGKTILFGTFDNGRWIPDKDIVVTVDIKEVYAELESGENITEKVDMDKGFLLVLEGESNVKTFNLYNDQGELQAELSDVEVETDEFKITEEN